MKGIQSVKKFLTKATPNEYLKIFSHMA